MLFDHFKYKITNFVKTKQLPTFLCFPVSSGVSFKKFMASIFITSLLTLWMHGERAWTALTIDADKLIKID